VEVIMGAVIQFAAAWVIAGVILDIGGYAVKEGKKVYRKVAKKS
jgi:hypothetical protein